MHMINKEQIKTLLWNFVLFISDCLSIVNKKKWKELPSKDWFGCEGSMENKNDSSSCVEEINKFYDPRKDEESVTAYCIYIYKVSITARAALRMSSRSCSRVVIAVVVVVIVVRARYVGSYVSCRDAQVFVAREMKKKSDASGKRRGNTGVKNEWAGRRGKWVYIMCSRKKRKIGETSFLVNIQAKTYHRIFPSMCTGCWVYTRAHVLTRTNIVSRGYKEG